MMLMIDDFNRPISPNVESYKQKPLDIFTTDDSIKSAAVQKPLVDVDKLEDMMGVPEDPKQPTVEATKTSKRLKLIAWWKQRSKKQHMLLIVASLLVLGLGSGGLAYFVVHKNKPKANALAVTKVDTKKVPVVTTVASTLSGLPVEPIINARPVIGVMIENSPDARPQSGLDQASVVFEAIAEGGITRFLTLFQDTQPDYVGPVRSVRPYYEQWVLGFDAPIAHVGGSPEALANIKAWGVKDLDQFYNSGSYRRVGSRAAPHNVYASVADLTNLAVSKGYSSSTFTGFERKAEKPYKAPVASSTATAKDSRTPANVINLAISGALYNVRYDYDAATNSYKRNLAGQPHMSMDAAGAQKQITPKVVIALAMSYGIQSDGKHSVYGTIGSGQAFVFQDGTVTTGTWSKASSAEQFKFTDASGKPLTINPGQTWITAVGAAGNVTYQ